MFNSDIKSIFDLLNRFSDEDKCYEYLEALRWQGKTPASPFSPDSKVYKCKGRRYKCSKTNKYFTVKTGTMYDGTKISLQKWFMATWIITTHKKGLSSLQLAEQIDVSQKTAWFLLHRIRANFGIENYNELDGIVEADESFYGGKNKNRHKNKRCMNYNNKYKFDDKALILGMVQRNGKLNAFVIPDRSRESIQPLIRQYVKPTSVLVADNWTGYEGLGEYFQHRTVKDSDKGYIHGYDPSTHTNSIENSWKIMKNSLRDMYNHVSRKHLQVYVNEFVYRYNMRQHPHSDKFNWLQANSGTRTKYRELTASRL